MKTGSIDGEVIHEYFHNVLYNVSQGRSHPYLESDWGITGK
jgi:hypothetical protein